LFDEKCGHKTAQRPRKDFHYNNARTPRGEFLLPGARLLPQDAFFAMPRLCI
jgi:hypothetical protein